MLTGAKIFFRASKPNSSSLVEDFHNSSSLSFVSNWQTLPGYYMVLYDYQESDMVRIGFLSQVSPHLWRNDLKDTIKETELFQAHPFQFRLYLGLLSSNRKGAVAPVLWWRKRGRMFYLVWLTSKSPLMGKTPYLHVAFLTYFSHSTKTSYLTFSKHQLYKTSKSTLVKWI
jgi:hypothetical protein